MFTIKLDRTDYLRSIHKGRAVACAKADAKRFTSREAAQAELQTLRDHERSIKNSLPARGWVCAL